MLLKKSTIAICSSNNISQVCLPQSITSSCSPSPRKPQLRRELPSLEHRPRVRTYATVCHGSDGPRNDGASPKHEWPTAARPSPYEIFGQQAGAPYSKKVFYELVKIYHPDRHHHSSHVGKPSRAILLERYRLVVAANTILCDPVKRRAYDLYGAGWGGHTDTQNDLRAADRSWRQEPDNPSMNATWEDWEQWYERRDGKKRQEPVYASNGSFAIGLLICILLGGWGQMIRAGKVGVDIMNLRDEEHGVITAAIRRRQEESSGLNREGRVENFLRQRDGPGADRCSAQDRHGARAETK